MTSWSITYPESKRFPRFQVIPDDFWTWNTIWNTKDNFVSPRPNQPSRHLPRFHSPITSLLLPQTLFLLIRRLTIAVINQNKWLAPKSVAMAKAVGHSMIVYLNPLLPLLLPLFFFLLSSSSSSSFSPLAQTSTLLQSFHRHLNLWLLQPPITSTSSIIYHFNSQLLQPSTTSLLKYFHQASTTSSFNRLNLHLLQLLRPQSSLTSTFNYFNT